MILAHKADDKPFLEETTYKALTGFINTSWHPAAFGDFRENTAETHVALRRNFSGLVSATDLVKGSKDTASLLVCTQKNFLLGGCRFFVSDVISGRILGHLGPLYLALGANH